MFLHEFIEAMEFFAVPLSSGEFRLKALLPAAVQIETLLGAEAEVSLVVLPVFQHTELAHQLLNVNSFFVWNRDVMCRPGITGDFVLSAAGVTAGLIVHLQDYEIAVALLLQPPTGRESAHAGTDDDHARLLHSLRRAERDSVAKAVSCELILIHKRSRD
jgi:hypothetical protein